MELDDSVGFRFHPTEQEIISYFLERKMLYPAWPSRTIREVQNICKFEPWALPKHSPLPSDDQVWYFFSVPVSLSPNSTRIGRTTNIGFWKLTGKDRPIRDKQGKKEIGYKRNLVFYRGRSPNGIKTNWVMHEYHSNKVSSDKEKYVLFRLKRKSGDSSDACDDEPSGHLASDSRNHVAASQDNNFFSQLLSIQEEERTSHYNGFDSNLLSELLPSIPQQQQRTSCSNGLDRNSLSGLFSSIKSGQGTSYSNGAHTTPPTELFSSIQQSEQRTSYSNGADRIPHSSLFSSIQQSEQRPSYSNGTYHNPLSEIFSSIQSEQRPSNSNGADCNALSELFSLIQQSEQRTSYHNGADRNPVSELFSSAQHEQGTSYSNGADRNSLYALFSSIQQEQGTSVSIGFNDEWTDEQEDAFLYLSDQDEYNGEKSTHTILHDVNPPTSVRGMHIGDGCDTDTEIVFSQSGEEFEIPILFNGNTSSKEYWQVPMVGVSNGTSSSSADGRFRGDSGIYRRINTQFELQSGNSDAEMFEINCLDELQMAEFPPSPRTCKAQHMPKSHRVIQEKCATERFQLLGMVSSKSVSNDEAREAATSVIDLPRKENKTDKCDKEQEMAQNTNAKTSSKLRSNESKGSNNNKCSNPPLGHITAPPLVYISNMLVSFVMILFFIREMSLFTE